jgi:multiple sugar transport system ATP-binding protein
MAGISLLEVTKRFDGTTAVDRLSLEIADREFLVLLGPSGCGKTTTLNIVAGFEELTAGRVLIQGRDVSHVPVHRRNLAMVFQSYALYPHMTARDNMSFPLRMMGVPKPDIARRVKAAAETLGIRHLLDRRPRQLSGGERQRVALGRAIVREPAAFLMDEPLSNLDAALRLEMRGELKKLHERLRATFVYVTHDQAEALTLAERVAVMNHGVLQQVGTPYEIYYRPANMFVARFLGSPPMNLLSGELVVAGGALRFVRPGLELTLPEPLAARLAAAAPKRVVLGVRPEDLVVGVEGGGAVSLEGAILLIEPLGPDLFLEVGIEQGTMRVRTSSTKRFGVGESLRLSLPVERVHFFDASTEQALAG